METNEQIIKVSISQIGERDGLVTVSGVAERLGNRRVELIVNDDLNRRYVAVSKENGEWSCSFSVPYNGSYKVVASIRDYSDFNRIRCATSSDSCFMLEGSNVWGATVTKHTDGLYYMIFSTWDTHDEFKTDWYHYSELGYAVSARLNGPYTYCGKALDASYGNTTHAEPIQWSYGRLDVFHNPTLLRSERDGKYYLYFMGTSLDDPEKSHRRQRTGVAYAEHPAGPWTVMDAPVFDVREHWEWFLTSNPSVAEVKQADGSYLYYAVYKGSGTYEEQRLTATGRGTASDPLGPFLRADAPIMRDPAVGFSVEDCYVWHHNGRYYALAKDMTKGNLTGVRGAYSYALFESLDGEAWGLAEHKLAFRNEIPWEKGTQTVSHLERSQLYVEDGIPFLICNATTISGESPYLGNQPYNVQIPLLGALLASDEALLTVADLRPKQVDRGTLEQLLGRAETMDVTKLEGDRRKRLQSAVRGARILLQRDSEQDELELAAALLRKAVEN